MIRLLLRLPWRSWRVLDDRQGVPFFGRIVLPRHAQTRGAGLCVPIAELRKLHSTCVFHGDHKVLARYGLSIVALEVKIDPFAELLAPEQGGDHADDFRPLLVNGSRVEVVDLDIRIRPDRMRHRACVFWAKP